MSSALRTICERVFWLTWVLLVAVLAGALVRPHQAHAQFIGPSGGVDSLPFGAPPDFSFVAPAAGDYATLIASTGQTITCSRASTDTVMTSPTTLVAVASGHCGVDYRGLQSEAAATNYALQAEHIDNAAWSKLSATVLGDQCAFVDGTTSMDKVTTSAANGQVFQLATTPSGTTFTGSGWLATTSGSQTMSLGVECVGALTVSACSCTASLGTCTTTSLTHDCIANITAGTTPIRVAATAVCSGANAGAYIEASPGTWQASSGFAGCVGGMQLEIGNGATSYIPTAGTSVARPLTTMTLPKPASVTMATGGAYSASVTATLATATATYRSALGSNANFVGQITPTSSSANQAQAFSDSAGTIASVAYADASKTSATRYAMQVSAGTAKACAAGTCGSGASMGAEPAEPTTLYLGGHNGATPLGGWISSACLGRVGACPP